MVRRYGDLYERELERRARRSGAAIRDRDPAVE
jgi:hypothetical protein